MKKVFLIIVIAGSSVAFYPMELNQTEVKKAFAETAKRCAPRWLMNRTAPLLVGAGLLIISPFLLLGAVLGQPQSDYDRSVQSCMGLTGIVALPSGGALVARQLFLIKRDLGLYFTYSRSTTALDTEHFPTVQTLEHMENYNQLLKSVADYTRENGNIAEKLAILTPGFRGYNTTTAVKY